MASENPSPGFDPAQWPPPEPQELQAMLPKYQVSTLIGRGGMGAVYLGRQDALDRPVAIKILPPGLEQIDPAYGARFRQEAMSLAKLNHPGIVAVYDFGRTEQGLWYIVMEYVDGTDVGRMLEQQGRVRSKDAMAITAHVCDALAYAHARGIIHRDIKPANILIAMNGAVKVADFGLAKTWQAGASSLTISGHAMGTPHYIAPEALAAEGTVDARADVYALGVMLYHMLTGDLPRGLFEPASHKINGLDQRFDPIITQALKNDPAQRYQGVEAMRRDLDALLTRPVVKVDPAAAQAPAALNTVPQPRRPAPPAPRPPSRPQPRKKAFDWGFWLPVGSVVIGLAMFFGWKYLPVPERKTIQRIEGEALKVIKVTGGETRKQEMGDVLTSIWSGAAQLLWTKGGKDDSLTLRFPVNEAGRQRVKAVFSLSHDFAVVDVALDGKRVAGAPFDLQAEVPTTSDILDFGVFDLTQGEHELKITLSDTHARDTVGAGAYVTALDYIQLEPPLVSKPPAAAGTDVALTARPSASHCSRGDHVKHINDGKVISAPSSSHPQRMTWYARKGGMEWAQLEWDTPQMINECQVVWFTDTNSTLPVFWRLLYREESGAWVPVEAAMPPALRDQWCVVKFPAVRTHALRISVQCTEGSSAGLCHWKALAADPAAAVDSPAAKRSLFLGDLSPLPAQAGHVGYRVNLYEKASESAGHGVFQGGKPCPQFLWAHTNSRIDFAIPSGYTRFTAFVTGPSERSDGVPLAAAENWTATVQVDGKSLVQSCQLSLYKTREYAVDINFPAGSKNLTLITRTLGDGRFDHAFWAYPMLRTVESQRLPATASTPGPPFSSKKIPEGALRTSTLSTARIPPKRQGEKFGLHFINIMPETVKLYWLTGDKQYLYQAMLPGDEQVMNTYDGHVWLITNTADEPLACILGSPSKPVIVVDSAGRGSSDPAPHSATEELASFTWTWSDITDTRKNGGKLTFASDGNVIRSWETFNDWKWQTTGASTFKITHIDRNGESSPQVTEFRFDAGFKRFDVIADETGRFSKASATRGDPVKPGQPAGSLP